MSSGQLSLVDSDVVSEGYGLAILIEVAKTTLNMTDKTLEKAVRAFQDPVPVTKRGVLYSRLQQWVVTSEELKRHG